MSRVDGIEIFPRVVPVWNDLISLSTVGADIDIFAAVKKILAGRVLCQSLLAVSCIWEQGALEKHISRLYIQN